MRVAPQIATVLGLVLLLTWFAMVAADPEAEVFEHALAELDHFGMIQNALDRDVFTARAGMLRNYDPLVREINALHASLQRLRGTAAFDADTQAAIDELATSIDRQQELVELFKSENALLHNSLSFFERFSVSAASPELAPATSAAVAAILHLTLDTSTAAVRDVEDRLGELKTQASQADEDQQVEALLAHGRLLNKLLPSVDGILKTMRALPQKQQQDVVHAMIVRDQFAFRTSARWFRALLYGTSLLLVAFLVDRGIRLKSRADALARRAAAEHLIAGISMRFINVSPQTLDAEIDRALAEIAAFCGADRTYIVMSGSAPRQHIWHKPGMEPPPGWPELAPDLANRIGTGEDGVVKVPDIRRMPTGETRAICLNLGLGAWACVTNQNADGVRVALGFDAIGRPCHNSKTSEHALLRMVLDTIVQAVERNAIEKERTRLEARLRHARRMEKIGIFTSGIAHNFNNILGGILGHSELMEEHIGPDAKLVRNLGGIRRSAERARDLVDQIMVFGRRREFGGQLLSVGALIAETASLLKVSLPPDIGLIIRQPPMAAIISGERAQLQQVLLNLCNNAANAMPAGGRIEISTELHETTQPRSLNHVEIQPGRYVCIAVTDTGHGLDKATLARIFEPFFTTRSSGNGLGLATVSEIIRDHDGAVNVQSQLGQGSRFEVWLPQTAATEQASEVGAAAPLTGRGQTIMLVAEDAERVLREEEMLAALGYEPVGFTSVDAATTACRADPHRFDMVIVGDFGSAAVSLDLAAALHATIPRVPIVLATTTVIEIGADTLVSAGISDVVRWPIVAEEIAIALADGAAIKRADRPPPRQASATTSSLH
jgi:signal transduction histidine kinase